MATPHDDLFHRVFQHARHAAGWLRSVLPQALASAIDWSTLHATPEKVHGRRLRLRITDIVFAAELKRDRHSLYLVPEHKSYHDPELHDQVLQYSVHLAARSQSDRAPPTLVVPIVVYHGNKPWAAPAVHPHLAQLDAELAGTLGGLQPRVHFLVDDLTRCTEAELRRPGLTPLAQLTLLCLAFLPRLSATTAPEALDRWGDLLRAADRDEGPPRGRDAVDAIAWYCLHVTEIPDQDLHVLFERNLQRPEETIMSTAEKLRREAHAKGSAEGHAKGCTEGHARGRAEAILRQLRKRFGSVPSATIERVHAASLPELDCWTDRILDAATLADVFTD
ncbi:MAG: Rpn family recombination-promoting nuclease/putative transposase [Planctomycetota bacterium]